MAGTPSARGNPITDKRELAAYLAAGAKPRDAWRIGTEHEKFVFRRADRARVPYEGPDGIGAVLEGFRRFGWEPVLEHGRTIALTRGGASISLEPGGQFELSGAPLESLHDTAAELDQHLAEMRAVTEPLGVAMVGLGFDPKWRRDDVPWMPKGRYRIMRDYMPKVGSLGLDMMTRTCTVQVNLDFGSEADMVKKFRVSLALQPVATALFAASPFTEGRPNGFQSYRSHIWTDTDPHRCGMLPFVFEPGFGFERYVDWLLEMPMYFVYRNGGYVDVSGQSFKDFMAGRLPGLPGEVATQGDFADHLATAFPEVRLKRFLEMRGADAGPRRRLLALPALWVGLLYDDVALDAAWDLVRDWSVAEQQALRQATPRLGLAAPFRHRTVRDIAVQTLAIAAEGLRRRARLAPGGDDESAYLEPLFAMAGSGRSLADDLLARFYDRWDGSVDPLFAEYAY